MKRRSFLKRTVPLLAAPIVLGRGIDAFARPLDAALASMPATDRVLVLIQLEGGNDGLNTVVPIDDDLYHRARPNLRIDRGVALALDGQPLLALHPSLGGVQRLYKEGTLAIVENIGYERMNLSHFTGTEIWHTASGPRREEFLTTGWIGRYLEREFPEYPDVLPAHPPAIEISPATSSVFTLRGSSVAMSLTDPEEFYALVNGGPAIDEEPLIGGRAGREWSYVESIGEQSRTYAEAVRAASARAANGVTYADDALAASLAIVARLIAGGLETRLYKVTIRGFDTHTGQLAPHAALLASLGGAIESFQRDLAAHGVDDRVVGMTYSEFGRRVRENGSGTDHGTAAPHFVFGAPIAGGRTLGGVPRLDAADEYGNLPHAVDFRCYFASVLAPLFAIGDEALRTILPIGLCDVPSRLPLYRTSAVGGDGGSLPLEMDLR